MTGQPEEITMYPYQLSKALADERIHDMVTRTERHGRTAARDEAAKPATASLPLSGVVAHLLGRLHVPSAPSAARDVRTPARDTSTRTSPSTAGPMGCVA